MFFNYVKGQNCLKNVQCEQAMVRTCNKGNLDWT